jgi:hypothetical protein
MPPQQTLKVDGQTLARGEANLLLIELNRMPERPGIAAKGAATAVKRAILEYGDVALTYGQAAAIRRAIEGIRIKRRNLPPGLSALRAQLAGLNDGDREPGNTWPASAENSSGAVSRFESRAYGSNVA